MPKGEEGAPEGVVVGTGQKAGTQVCMAHVARPPAVLVSVVRHGIARSI